MLHVFAIVYGSDLLFVTPSSEEYDTAWHVGKAWPSSYDSIVKFVNGDSDAGPLETRLMLTEEAGFSSTHTKLREGVSALELYDKFTTHGPPWQGVEFVPSRMASKTAALQMKTTRCLSKQSYNEQERSYLPAPPATKGCQYSLYTVGYQYGTSAICFAHQSRETTSIVSCHM